MKKSSDITRAVPALKAHEALALAEANPGRLEKDLAAQASRDGAACLRFALGEIHEAASKGRTRVFIHLFHAPDCMTPEARTIMARALRGMGYRVHDTGKFSIEFVIRWDPRPEGRWGGLWWDFLNGHWRDNL